MYYSSFCHVGNENFCQFVHTNSEIQGKPIYNSISENSLCSYFDIVILLKINKKRYLFLHVNIYIINLIKIFSIELFKRKMLLGKFTDFHTSKMLSILNINRFLKVVLILLKNDVLEFDIDLYSLWYTICDLILKLLIKFQRCYTLVTSKPFLLLINGNLTTTIRKE